MLDSRKQAEAELVFQDLDRETGYSHPAPDLTQLIDKGPIETYKALFGQTFVDALASHHIEAIVWHWESRIAFLTNERPEYLAYFPIWSRGHMKSTTAERMVIVDAILSAAYKQPGYCLYLSRNKDKVQEHIANIETLLSSPAVRYWCPDLATPQRTEITNQQRRWTSSFLKTNANYSIQGGTLESGLAGSRVEETRPTWIVPDDIDAREDSPVIAEGRFRQLTTEILPMRQTNTLVFFAQNLISRYSVMYRIQTGQARVLTNRKPTEPVPAVIDPVYEQRTVGGIIKDILVSGESTWHCWDYQRIQDEIDTEGKEAFERECNHKVDQSKEGVILYNYDDSVHVISESEFAAVFGSVDAWLSWRKKPGNDWARTKTDKHANVAAWLTRSPVDSPLPNFTFLMYPMSFPANSAPEDVAERLLSCLSPYAYGQTLWSDLRKDVLRRAKSDVYAKTVSDKIDYEHGELAQVVPGYAKPLLQRCNVQQGEMSHEQDTVRKLYSRIYGIGMRPINPRRSGGIEDINRAMRVDYESKHAFREGGGYSQFHLVVPDDAVRGAYTEINGVGVYHPRTYPAAIQTADLHDSDLCRFQINNCRYRDPVLTATGEELDLVLKLHDDFFNLLQFFYVGSPLAGSSLTMEQKIQMLIPSTIKEAVKTTQLGFMDYEFQKEIVERSLQRPDYDPLEFFE